MTKTPRGTYPHSQCPADQALNENWTYCIAVGLQTDAQQL